MEITLKLDNRSKDGKTLMSFLKNLSYVEVIETKKTSPASKNIPNTETKKAMQDAKNGKVYKSKNFNDLMQHLNS